VFLLITIWSISRLLFGLWSKNFFNIFESFFKYFSNHHNYNLTFTNHFCTLGSIFVINVWIACTLQCNTLTGFLKTTGWIGCVHWEEQDFIPLLWTIKVLHVLISLNQTKIGAGMYLWYVYACVCGCNLPWAYDQELGTNILSGSLSNLQHSHRIYLDMCTYRDVCICLYIYVHTRICVCIRMNMWEYMYVYVFR